MKKKRWLPEEEELVLEKGDALFRLSENGKYQSLYLTDEESWPSFMAFVLIHVLNHQHIFDECANDYVRHMSEEERATFLPLLRTSKYAH